MEKLNSVQTIKRYFEADGGRQVTMAEFRALSADERMWLATEAAKAMGTELVAAS